jgi:uncharacterized repeat protein (TIGR01451 family)/LPXTG-motif cell wall-anchored protein
MKRRIIMNKILRLVRRAPKRLSALVAIIAAAVIVPASLLAWGPARQTFTTAQPAHYVTFNSIIDNPSHGDERNFSQVREANASNTTYADSTSLTPGHEYVVYVYYHNNAATNYNASGVGVATGAYVKSEIPAVVPNGSTGTKAMNYVGAANANPGQVWDDVSFSNTSGADIALRYVPGSTTIHTFGKANGQTMSDSIITTGAPIGYDSLNGVVPGCNEYAGYVTYRVKADQPNFTVSKQVHKTGTTGWKETESLNAGDSVDYLVTYKNTGTTVQNNVVINDILPAGVSYTNGSTYVANGTNPSGILVGDNVTKGGINIGNYAPGAAAYIKFSAKVTANEYLPVCGPNTLRNVAKAQTNNGTKQDTADVTVNKSCEPTPEYTCKSLGVQSISRTQFKFTTGYTVKNATFKNVTYIIRDAAGKEVERKTSTASTLDYTRTTVGTYTVQAVVTVTVNGQDKTVSGTDCTKPFEVTAQPATPVYTCDALTVKRITRTEFTFSTAYTVKDATFKNVTYIIRDAKGKEVERKTSTASSINYTRSVVGTYTVEAVVTVAVKGADKTVTSAYCKKAFEVPSVPEYCTVPGKEHLPKNSPDCVTNPEFCTVPGKETLPKNSPDCIVVVTPPELPQTGASENIVAFLGLGALIASIGYYVASRRALMNQ